MSVGLQVTPVNDVPRRSLVARVPRAAWPLVWRGASLLVGGMAVGLLWATLAPVVHDRSDGIEAEISGEVTFAALALVAGVVVAVRSLLRPGRRPLAGTVVDLVGSAVASAVAWGTGRVAGAPVLAATGVLVLWPLTVALVTAVVTLVVVLVQPDQR